MSNDVEANDVEAEGLDGLSWEPRAFSEGGGGASALVFDDVVVHESVVCVK